MTVLCDARDRLLRGAATHILSTGASPPPQPLLLIAAAAAVADKLEKKIIR